MNKEIKKKWVKALRSGKYKKGVSRLKTNDGRYCCLGVLTDLYRKENKVSWKKATETNDIVLPICVQDWAGLHDSSPGVFYKKTQRPLSNINDDTRITFKGIATLIDKSL